MSRSCKRIPCCKDYNWGMKKQANRYLRRNCLDIPSGRAAYKKLFCSYDICDYKFLEPFRFYKRWMQNNNERNYSDKELYKIWYKDYKMK